MKHGGNADCGPQVPRAASELQQRFGRGPKKQIVDNGLVVQSQGPQLLGQREDSMKVGYGKHPLFPRFDPLGLAKTLALWAMSVSA
jgi:hypothetical protein